MRDEPRESLDDLLSAAKQTDYQSLVGGLNWTAVITRPDIAYPVSRLAKFNSNPAPVHKEAAERTLRYLAQTADIGLIYREDPPSSDLYGYTDSNFAANEDNRRSTSGFLFLGFSACVHWQSKQQSLIARSTHQAEYIGMAKQTPATRSHIFANSSRTLRLPPLVDLDPTLLYGDNMGAITTATNPDGDKTARTRHIDIRYHITREALVNGILRLKYVQTAEMIVDILTKPLPLEAHNRHMKNTGLASE